MQSYIIDGSCSSKEVAFHKEMVMQSYIIDGSCSSKEVAFHKEKAMQSKAMSMGGVCE